MKARTASEPGAHFRVFVRGVVVHDQVHVEILGHALLDVPQERQILLMPMARLALREDLSVGDIQRCKQGRRPMMNVVHHHGADFDGAAVRVEMLRPPIGRERIERRSWPVDTGSPPCAKAVQRLRLRVCWFVGAVLPAHRGAHCMEAAMNSA